MSERAAGALIAALTLSACAPVGGPATATVTTTTTATTTATATATETVSVTPTPSPSPSLSIGPTADLPLDLTIKDDLLDGGAMTVVQAMRLATGNAPVLKLDVTESQVTMTVLVPGPEVRTVRWRDDVIRSVNSDVEYLGQATFDPTQYPLDHVGVLLDKAREYGAEGDLAILQIVEYRDDRIFMTVTTRPESGVVFLRKDGSVVRQLDTTTARDIATGLADATAESDFVIQVGISPTEGYWADEQLADGVVERWQRVGGVPAFSAQRKETSGLVEFDPHLLDAEVIADTLKDLRETPDQACTVEANKRQGIVVIRYQCGAEVRWSDIKGHDLTEFLN